MPTLRPAVGKYREYGKKFGLHINPRSWLLYAPASSCAKRQAERALIAKELLDKELFLIEILYLGAVTEIPVKGCPLDLCTSSV